MPKPDSHPPRSSIGIEELDAFLEKERALRALPLRISVGEFLDRIANVAASAPAPSNKKRIEEEVARLASKRRLVTNEERAIAEQLRKRGLSWDAIASRMDRSDTCVRQMLPHLLKTKCTRKPRRCHFTGKEILEVVRLRRDEHLSFSAIGRKLGRDHGSISKLYRRIEAGEMEGLLGGGGGEVTA